MWARVQRGQRCGEGAARCWQDCCLQRDEDPMVVRPCAAHEQNHDRAARPTSGATRDANQHREQRTNEAFPLGSSLSGCALWSASIGPSGPIDTMGLMIGASRKTQKECPLLEDVKMSRLSSPPKTRKTVGSFYSGVTLYVIDM